LNYVAFDFIHRRPNALHDEIKAEVEKMLAKTLHDECPDVVGVSCTFTMNHSSMSQIFSQVKKFDPSTITLAGGHFALPSDPVAKAVKRGTAIYNSFGSTVGDTDEVLAIGRSSYITIGNYYFQTTYDQEEYEQGLASGKLPIHRMHKLSKDDQIRRQIIKNLRTYFAINFEVIEKQWDINFRSYFKSELSKLSEFESDGLLIIGETNITLTEEGQHFSNLIGSIFDQYLERTPFRKEINIRVITAT
jgi:coproporphyrinogen III oxidase-like Fe-S oxidoreductase